MFKILISMSTSFLTNSSTVQPLSTQYIYYQRSTVQYSCRKWQCQPDVYILNSRVIAIKDLDKQNDNTNDNSDAGRLAGTNEAYSMNRTASVQSN